MRIFLAIEIPDRIRKDLERIQRGLKSRLPGVRWEKPEKLHLTLVFLGEVDEEKIVELEKAVREGVKGIRPFKLKLSGVEVFPGGKKPRVVLVEAEGDIESFARLGVQLGKTLLDQGFSVSRKRPHVTIGRVKRRYQRSGKVGSLPPLTLPREEFEVKELVIMKSKLHPAGAIHTLIARISL